jgi:predicted RNA-binding protein
MSSPQYWLNLFSGKTWGEFIDHGADVTGFRDTRANQVRKIENGDRLICYVTGISRIIGMLEVTSEYYRDEEERIWEDDVFPCRLKVEPLILLDFETAIPIQSLKDELSIFEDMKSPNSWTGYVRSSPSKWKHRDGQAIYRALKEAKASPTKREVDESKLERRPKALKSDVGSVTVPENGEDEDDQEEDTETAESEQEDSTRKHTEIQHLLLKLGSSMGFDVWAARNDRNLEIGGEPLSELFDLERGLPMSFDKATMRTIEYIDVLWLSGHGIEAAFEVESTTSVYSGLLRMSDLTVMQPNLDIPLYLVAPQDRRDKVIREVNRPTFSNRDRKTDLAEVCRYISFETLRERIKVIEANIGLSYVRPDFLEELSEDCYPEEEG